jgi:hypothetical protein
VASDPFVSSELAAFWDQCEAFRAAVEPEPEPVEIPAEVNPG